MSVEVFVLADAALPPPTEVEFTFAFDLTFDFCCWFWLDCVVVDAAPVVVLVAVGFTVDCCGGFPLVSAILLDEAVSAEEPFSPAPLWET